MHVFPVEYSSLSVKDLLELLVKQYSLSSTSCITFLKRGFNDTYLIISGGQQLIARVYKHAWRSFKSIENEIDLLLYLNEHGVSVSIPVADSSQNYIQEINAPEGMRYLALFTYASGSRVRKLSIDQSFLLGAETAKLHVLTKNKQLSATAQDYDIQLQFNQTLDVVSPLLKEYPKQLDYLQRLKNDFASALNRLDDGGLAKGICHGDLQAENFHMDAHNQITFFDFDFFGKGYLVYDIGVFKWYDHKNKPPEIVNAFLKGYEELSALTPAEHQLIPWMGTLRALFQMTLYCKISDGKQLPLWQPAEVAAFIEKVEKWHGKSV